MQKLRAAALAGALRVSTTLTFLAALLMAGPVSSMAQTQATDNVTIHVGSASRAAHAFSRSHSMADLRSAVDEMVTAGNPRGFNAETFVAQRRTLVRGWAHVLTVIEGSYDPTYDPNDRSNWPVWGVPPPQTIHDPQLRAAAAAEIAANDKKVARMSLYHDLSVVDALAWSTLRMQLNQLRKIAPAGTDADCVMLGGILQQAGPSPALRATTVSC
ncbi:MAG TPA: hypothetical protein VGN14_04475 [Candidatus Elarobacter sp.]|jgi:hypothetical protein